MSDTVDNRQVEREGAEKLTGREHTKCLSQPNSGAPSSLR